MKRNDLGGAGSSGSDKKDHKERGWEKIKKNQKKSRTGKSGDKDETEIKGLNAQLGKKREPHTLYNKKKTTTTTHFRKEGDKKKARMHLKDEKKKPRMPFGMSQEVDPEETEETKAAPTKFAAENYTRAYQKKMHERLIAARKDEAVTATEKDPLADQKANTQRARARWLLDQVFIWKRKIGTGEYDDNVIQGNITIYERELYGIEYQYRP